MARDRQRAKQRKARRAQHPGPAPVNPGPAPSQPYRADTLPGELEHSSGEVDEFEARLVAGAGGSPRRPRGPSSDDDAKAADPAFGDGGRGRGPRRADLDEELEEQAVAAAPAERREVAAAPTPGTPTRRGPARFIAFLRASWAELQRVQWPDRRQVGQATAVVIGFVVVAGVYLGVADWVAKKIVDFIL